MVNGKRLLFFDLLRIVSVAAIVLLHIAIIYRFPVLSNLNLIFRVFYLDVGIVGVYVLIFVSGAMLEYSHPCLENVDELSEFYVKRLFRIYPAFWMSFLIGVLVSPYLLYYPPVSVLLECIGMRALMLNPAGYINQVSWFVGLIVMLYFSFPFLSASIRKYPYQMLVMIGFAEIFLRYFFNLYIPASGTDRWFPVCNFLEFGLGIWVVQRDIYPKWTHESSAIFFLADLSFYVFLVHLIAGMTTLMAISLPLYLIIVVLLSWLVLLGDREIQTWLKRKVGV